MTEYSKRTCGRASNASWTCDPVYFPVSGGPYSQVCGRIRAYQWGLPDAFLGFKRGQTTINDAYFSGVAVMHGSPRQHIWTFACGPFESQSDHTSLCPCDASRNYTGPTICWWRLLLWVWIWTALLLGCYKVQTPLQGHSMGWEKLSPKQFMLFFPQSSIFHQNPRPVNYWWPWTEDVPPRSRQHSSGTGWAVCKVVAKMLRTMTDSYYQMNSCN